MVLGVDVGGTKVAVAAVEGVTVHEATRGSDRPRAPPERPARRHRSGRPARDRAGRQARGDRRRRALADRLRDRHGRDEREHPAHRACRCARSSAGASGCPSSWTTTPTPPRSPRPTCSAIDHLVMLTLGTGRGRRSGDRRQDLPRARTGWAPSSATSTLNPDGPPCPGNCPNRGCIEAYCSGQALERDATELATDKPDSRARPLARRRRQGLRPGAWSRPPRTATPTPCSSSRTSARMLGIAIAGYVNVFEPERLTIGGGLSRAGHLFLDRAIQEADNRALPALLARTTIALAQGGTNAGMIGAAVLAAQEVEAQKRDTPRHARDHDRKGRMTTGSQLDELSINTIRTLSMDAVEKAKSGHPGRADGPRPAGVPAVHAGDEAQPRRRGLVRPRPLHPLGRARVDAALRVAATCRGYGLTARGPQELPPARQPDRGPPRARRRGRDRGHHRPARPGHLDGGRPGARRGDARRALQPAGPRPDRPPHVRDRERRRHAGGRGLGGLLAGGPPRARQADRLLRQQPHPARRARPRWPSPRTSAKRFEAYGWHVQDLERGPRRSSNIEAAIDGRRRRARPALPDHAAHAHRLRLAEQAGHQRRRTARRSARRRCASPRRPTAGTRTPTSSSRTRCSSTSGRRPASAAPRPRPSGSERAEAYQAEYPDEWDELSLVMEGAPARRLGRRAAQVPPGGRRASRRARRRRR